VSAGKSAKFEGNFNPHLKCAKGFIAQNSSQSRSRQRLPGCRDTTIVALLGVELNAEIEYQTARDSTIGAEEPRRAWSRRSRYRRSEAGVESLHRVERELIRHCGKRSGYLRWVGEVVTFSFSSQPP
jgi:hypothetical protein